MSFGRFFITAEAVGERLDRFLAANHPDVSRAQLQRRIEAGEVHVNGVVPRASQKLRLGDEVIFAPTPPEPARASAEAIPLHIVYEDRALLVIEKPAGLVVHPGAGHPSGTLVNALLHHVCDLAGVGGELRPGIVHRLDKDTSGLMVIAKDELTLTGLATQFKAHSIKRAYLALAVGHLRSDAATLRTLHGRDPHHRKRFSSHVKRGKAAVTHVRVLSRLMGATLVEARLETGRTHQVRVHLRDLGHPIVGDSLYGRAPRDPGVAEVANTLGRHALHASELGFEHPGRGEWMQFHSDLPDDFARALAALQPHST